MKTFFVPAGYIGSAMLEDSMIGRLPNKVGLASTVQFLSCLNDVKVQIEKTGRKVFIGRSMQGNDGQILGCDVSSVKAIADKVDAFLYIGSGEFHPRGIGLVCEHDVFIFNPITKGFSTLDKNEIEQYRKRKKSAYIKFLSSKEIGVLVSTMQGQNNLKKALELKRKIKGKNFYIFISDTIDFSQLENFPFIECWVNTACPRIDEDVNCINLSEITASIDKSETLI